MMTDTERARDLVDLTRGHDSYDDVIGRVSAIAAAGLELRDATYYSGQGVDLNGRMGGTVPARDVEAFDAALRAALGDSTDAGAEAGEAGT